MIGWLHGRIVDAIHPGKVVMDVNGVGYDVEITLPTFFELSTVTAAVELHIHTIVREDALLLYGFINKEDRALFRALIKVNGVGPKLAIAILSSIQPNEFIQCIQRQDTAWLVKLPGIGKKTAERLVVEMKDSIRQLSTEISAPSFFNVVRSEQDEALDALVALGYKHQEASKAMTKIDDGHKKTCEQWIRQALQVLAS